MSSEKPFFAGDFLFFRRFFQQAEIMLAKSCEICYTKWK